MKKLILSLAFACLSAVSAMAVKAWPHPIAHVQSNGDTIYVRINGDEHFHWYTDMQGNILKKEGQDFVKLDVDPQTYIAQHTAIANTRAGIEKAANLFPHTGKPRVAVILANFADKKFMLPNPRKSFEQYLNSTADHPEEYGNGEGRNYSSVKQYFMTMSNGKFEPQFDIYGPITLPGKSGDYGGQAEDGHDERTLATKLVQDACTAMGDSLPFAQYDQDNDGNADLVYIIYAGYGQNMSDDATLVWPKRFSGFSSPKFGGKGINQCGISNELIGNTKFPSEPYYRISGIGLFCHEFSHCLGLPDLYPTSTPAQGSDNQGMEDWSLMDNGEYVYNGYCPTAYTAWEREQMGWETIPQITEGKQYKLTSETGQRAVKVVNPSDANEYFILECFEDKGWNQRIATYNDGSVKYNPTTRGLMIYHVKYDASKFSLGNNTVNNTKGKPGMTIIPADGALLTSYKIDKGITPLEYAKSLNGDIFRSDDTVNDSTFTQTMNLPNAAWWTTAEATPIYNINYKDGAVYFDFLNKVATTGIGRITNEPDRIHSDRIYTLDGRYVGTDIHALPHGIYIRGGKKYVK